MDLNQAILYGQLVNAAYAILPGNTTNAAGQIVTVGAANYQVVTSIFANDLATDINPTRGQSRVSIGLILQAATAGDVVIAVRGTEGVQEWIHDAEFLLVPCPFLAGAGQTEDGFTAMFLSMTTSLDPSCPSVTRSLPTLTFPRPVTSLTLCGREPRRRACHLARPRRCRQLSIQESHGLHLCQSAHRRSPLCRHLQPSRAQHHPHRRSPRSGSEVALAPTL
jgi:hypothetical protein